MNTELLARDAYHSRHSSVNIHNVLSDTSFKLTVFVPREKSVKNKKKHPPCGFDNNDYN